MSTAVGAVTTEASWFVEDPRGSGGAGRMFCFPHAGGSPAAFREWTLGGLRGLETWIAELPGRGRRIREEAVGNMNRVVSEVVQAMLPHLDQPYALFGHSMGAWIAFEVARAIEEAGAPPPRILFVAGMRGPHCPARHDVIHTMSEAQLIRELRRMGGTPRQILADKQLLKRFILPTMREDHRLMETYEPVRAPISAPIHSLAGSDDPHTTREEIQAWEEYTTARFTAEWYPGGHFFVHDRPERLVPELAARFDCLAG